MKIKMRMLSLKINILHALKNYFDNEKKVNLQFFDFPRRAHFTIESNRCVFALQNCLSRGNHVEFSSVSLFLVIVVRSVTTEVVTLRDNFVVVSPPIRDG